MEILRPKACSVENLRKFHSNEYIRQCIKLPPSNAESSAEEALDDAVLDEYGLGYDCPLFKGLKEYMCVIAGATLSACYELRKCIGNAASEKCVVINWAGGWHHAHRDKASGFCYVNDIVLGILELRKSFQRVLYIDLDLHHGDGVQEAFETTKRVFTLSFHHFEAGFFPGTGDVNDCGMASGKGYAANFPYRSGIAGANFIKYFKRLTLQILERYQPEVCVVQCGADAIVGDPLGGTNLTPDHLIKSLSVVLGKNIPTLLLGGGGYNIPNACRYWTVLTAAVCGHTLNGDIPESCADFSTYGPDFTLSINEQQFLRDSNMELELESNASTIEHSLRKYNVSAV